MTVRVERTIELHAPQEAVWTFISDPANRANAISVVADYELDGDGRATWHVTLPIPFISRTIKVETRDVESDPPRHVKFVGRSKVMSVVGEHDVEETEDGCRLVSRFTVDGKVPGVERFFERNLDGELANLERALSESLEAQS